MPSGDHAAGKAGQRARGTARANTIESSGGPRHQGTTAVGLDWYAKNLEPRAWADIEHEVELVGEVECLVGSASASVGGFTMQLQVLPAYQHDALNAMLQGQQGVLVCRFYQAPWDLFAQDTPAWDHLNNAGDETGAD